MADEKAYLHLWAFSSACKHCQASATGCAGILSILAPMHVRQGSTLHDGRGGELFDSKLSAAITLVSVCGGFHAAAHARRCPHMAGRLQ